MRTRSAWLVAIPFLLLSRPTPTALAAGATVTGVGLLLRGWAAGTIRKDEVLTTSGPYAFLRHPLYVGSFLIGIGLSAGGGHWIWPAAVIVYFAVVYQPTVAAERERLTRLFGARYLEYVEQVPALVPRTTPYRPSVGTTSIAASDAPASDARAGASRAARGFAWSRYRARREWEALLGAGAALAVLAAKLYWRG
jgi:hypothetical protein